MNAIGGLNVSHETIERLEVYAEALKKWNPRINLVAKSTVKDLWNRHFLDSAQLLHLAPEDTHRWVDIGSGGGFPGLVIAILAKELRTDLSVIAVESDHRKCAFLRSVIRDTSISAEVIAQRVEELPPMKADVVSARALADLSSLLFLATEHLAPGGVMLFPKGKNWQSELAKAQSEWRFDHQVANSSTSDQSVILRISGVRRA